MQSTAVVTPEDDAVYNVDTIRDNNKDDTRRVKTVKALNIVSSLLFLGGGIAIFWFFLDMWIGNGGEYNYVPLNVFLGVQLGSATVEYVIDICFKRPLANSRYVQRTNRKSLVVNLSQTTFFAIAVIFQALFINYAFENQTFIQEGMDPKALGLRITAILSWFVSGLLAVVYGINWCCCLSSSHIILEMVTNGIYAAVVSLYILGDLWDDPYCNQCFGGMIFHTAASIGLPAVGILYIICDLIRWNSK